MSFLRLKAPRFRGDLDPRLGVATVVLHEPLAFALVLLVRMDKGGILGAKATGCTGCTGCRSSKLEIPEMVVEKWWFKCYLTEFNNRKGNQKTGSWGISSGIIQFDFGSCNHWVKSQSPKIPQISIFATSPSVSKYIVLAGSPFLFCS